MNNNKVNSIILFVMIVVGVSVTVRMYFNWLNQSDYWAFAPDGDYTVFVDTDYNVNYSEHTVFLPVCEHSGGDLHGSWSFTDDVTFAPYPEGCGYYGVRLEGNRIIIVWQQETA